MPIAIDIGTRALHLVQGSARKKQVTIKKVLIEPLLPGLIQDGIIREFTGMEEALRNLLQKHKIKDKTCSLTINGNHIYSRELVVPKSSGKIMHDLVSFEMQSSMNSSKAMGIEYVLSEKPVPDQPEMANVKASAVQLEYINDYYRLLRRCRLKPLALDIHANAISKVFLGHGINGQELDPAASFLVIDLGAFTTSAYSFSKGEMIYSRIIPMGGVDIERYVSRYNENLAADEQLLLDSLDLGPESLERDQLLAEAVRPLLATVGDGVQRIIQYLASRLQGEPVSKAYLVGRTALFPGLDRTLAREFGLQTETVRSGSQIKLPAGTMLAPFANAVGALIRLA